MTWYHDMVCMAHAGARHLRADPEVLGGVALVAPSPLEVRERLREHGRRPHGVGVGRRRQPKVVLLEVAARPSDDQRVGVELLVLVVAAAAAAVVPVAAAAVVAVELVAEPRSRSTVTRSC